jgi:hypothetical protein
MLGDIGALYGALLFIVNFFLDFYNASMFEDALIKTLFKFSDRRPSTLKIRKVKKSDVRLIEKNLKR